MTRYKSKWERWLNERGNLDEREGLNEREDLNEREGLNEREYLNESGNSVGTYGYTKRIAYYMGLSHPENYNTVQLLYLTNWQHAATHMML